MRYAIVSDIHANLRAWEAVLADLRSQNVDTIICLGDVVGYGPQPAEVLAAVRAETSHFVLGNHDAAAAGMMDYSIFNDHARQAIEWTMSELSEEATAFLASVPLAIEAGEILFVHAEVAEPGRFDYIDDTEMAEESFSATEHFVSFVGHTHKPKIFERKPEGGVQELLDETCSLDEKNRYIVNVGSVGEPRNPDDLRARYVIYDSETREVDFRRVDFDIVAYRESLLGTSLALRPYFLQVYEQVVEGKEELVSTDESMVDMQVAHGSAALVDLGQVSSMVNMQLASAKRSKAPGVILAAAAVLAFAALGIWALKSRGKSSEEGKNQLVIVADEEVKKEVMKPEPTRTKVEPREEAGEEPIAKMEEETPKMDEPPVKPEAMAAKLEPKPLEEPKLKKKVVEVASWRMDQAEGGASLVDETGQMKLVSVAEAKSIRPIAPNPVPLTQEENRAALQVGIWKEDQVGDFFGLTADKSFTCEGWFVSAKTRRPVFLMGTRSGEDDKTGWHIDLRPPSGGRREGQMSFYYDSGTKRTQALAEAVKVADLKPHHFAVVWDHDASREEGEMTLFLDGVKVATTPLRHSDILGKQVNLFRIGAKGNPAKLALDELRFTRKALASHEFLLKTPILGVTMLKSDPKSKDSWSKAENWEGGVVPSGDDNIIIEEGLVVQSESVAPKEYTGSLVLKEKANLRLHGDRALPAIPKAPSSLVLYQDSTLVLRTGNVEFGPIDLKGDAEIWGGQSTAGHRAIRRFEREIKGAGKLTINGVNNNHFHFHAKSRFTGGLRAHSSQGQGFLVFGSCNQAFGKGDVSIENNCSLIIGGLTRDTIDDSATLKLDGASVLVMNGSPKKYKLFLKANETVAGFFIDGEDQGEGVFSSETHPEIGGTGKLTVKAAE